MAFIVLTHSFIYRILNHEELLFALVGSLDFHFWIMPKNNFGAQRKRIQSYQIVQSKNASQNRVSDSLGKDILFPKVKSSQTFIQSFRDLDFEKKEVPIETVLKIRTTLMEFVFREMGKGKKLENYPSPFLLV